MLASSHYLVQSFGESAFYGALGLFALSWIAQFIGHGVFEGRSPALLDNMIGALVLAPFFAWLEMLFMVGYRPDLQVLLNSEIEKSIADYKRKKHQ
ncbi:hypothetical protein HK098_006755 [Nowakowskiella sp. JEL0407]|nr:hypothetical protein HK098_006755 [Nowakowskiella sp. JEL0407]